MGLFSKKKNTKEEKKVSKKTVKKNSENNKTVNSKKKTTAKKEKVVLLGNSELAYRFLVQPWITEKTHELAGENKYVFKVTKTADKKVIKLAIEELYKVKVEKVNIVNISAKKRTFGGKKGIKAGFKKAIITLKEGDKIELFS